METNDKKEVILVTYLNVGNLPNYDINTYMAKAIDKGTIESDQIKFHQLWIPVRNQETKVECVYPNYTIIDGQEAIDELKELNESLKKIGIDLENKLKEKE